MALSGMSAEAVARTSRISVSRQLLISSPEFSISSTAASAVQPLIPVLRDSQRPIVVGTLARAFAPVAIPVHLLATRARALPAK